MLARAGPELAEFPSTRGHPPFAPATATLISSKDASPTSKMSRDEETAAPALGRPSSTAGATSVANGLRSPSAKIALPCAVPLM